MPMIGTTQPTAASKPQVSTSAIASPLNPRRRAIFQGVTLVLAILIFEACARIAIWAVPAVDLRPIGVIMDDQSRQIQLLLDRTQPQWIEIHPVLGWRYAPHFRNQVHQMNSQALRSTRDYETVPPPSVLRVAAFGDSFVYGNEVANADAWPALIELEDPAIEVLNYGVGGYGLDQAYLRFMLEGSTLRPHVVVIGFTPDDLGRVTNVYRRFVGSTEPPLFKPRYLFDSRGELTLLANPVPERSDYDRLLKSPREVLKLGEHDLWYKPAVYQNPFYDWSAAIRVGSWLATRAYRNHLEPDRWRRGGLFNPTSSAFRINAALFKKFSRAVTETGAQPLIVILPDRDSVERARMGEAVSYEPLLERLRRDQLAYVDALEAFAALPDGDVGPWFARRGHYSPAGNKVVASWLRRKIRFQ